MYCTAFTGAGEESHFCFDLKTSAKLGHSFKDHICPDTMEFEKDYFKVGGAVRQGAVSERLCLLYF